MTPQEQALDVITKSLDEATKKGVFSLNDAGLILQSLQILRVVVNPPKNSPTTAD